MPRDRVVDDLADALLDGTPIDWAAAESSAEEPVRPLVRQLKIVSTIAELHRSMPANASIPSAVSGVLLERSNERSVDHWAHLRLLEQIGRGAFGQVYRAWDTRLDREVALKLSPAGRTPGVRAASSIIHEGRMLARVRHPNVVTIYGAEQIDDQIGLWMEFIRGVTLEQLLERHTLSATEAVDIGLEVCSAVSAVHGAGLLHRDIKAQNVMRADDGRIVLMDFGTGRELDQDARSDFAGTPLYLAPEVLRGQPATVRSDLYSLGVLLYHLVTGSYPVRAPNVAGIQQAHERGERTHVQTGRRDVPSKLARIIERAVDPEPERRYQSAEALCADLAALKPRRTLVRLAYAAAAAIVVMVIGAVAWEMRGRQVGSSTTPSTLLAGFVGVSNPRGATVSASSQPIIAVLPLKRLNTESEDDYFVDGLTDEILQNLATIQGLQVRSRTSSFAFKDRPRNLREVGERLGANLVLEGSVLRSGNKLRINAQLVQVAGEVTLWAETFDRDLKSTSDVFGVLDEISTAIVNKLRLKLNRGQRRYDFDLDTYERYLKARSLANRRGPDDSQKAVELFEQVIAADPAFAPAYAGLVDAIGWWSVPAQAGGGIAFETAYSMMRPAAVKALELDPLLAEAHAAMGRVYSIEYDWKNADSSFRKAIDLNPTLTQIYTNYSSSTLTPLGRFGEAEQLMQVAMRSDPLSLDVWREIGILQFLDGRYEDAVGTFERVRAVDPEYPYINMFLPRALMFDGRVDEALSLVEERTRAGKRSLPTHYLAHLYVKAGRREEAEKLVPTKDSPYSEMVLAVALGQMDRAFDAMDRMAVQEPARGPGGLVNPEVAPLRTDPRFAAFRKKFGLP